MTHVPLPLAALDALHPSTNASGIPPIHHASVKVMRSYDYCHFEVTLSSDQTTSTAEVDALRKEAARLADKAVAQYKTAKAAAARVERLKDAYYLKAAKNTPEGERSPEEKALIKYHQDAAFAARFAYDYEDDYDPDPWQDDDEPHDA